MATPPLSRAVYRSAALVGLLSATARGQTPPPDVDKSHYSILNPTPKEFWRPMSPDRPDTTESAYTVDAGAVQIELSFFDYAKDGSSSLWTAAPVNLKLGILNNMDLQLVFDPYINANDGQQVQDGIGELQVRSKINLWGNDSGATAMAFMPFIRFPTASESLGSGHVEGGLIFPWAAELTETVGIALMFETDFVWDAADNGYDTEFVGTGVVGLDVTDALGLYLEGIAITSTQPGSSPVTPIIGLGATYGFTNDIQLDAGVNIGLGDAADDINVFTGITFRF